MKFRHDYSQCMMMKLKMAEPDRKGGSTIICDVDRAVEIIGIIDKLTLGIKKIIYLVGWQYLGHDDKYPAFFSVNDSLKRDNDASAKDSLLYLMREAKKSNTIISLHVNFTDAYEDSPVFDDYLNADALICGRNGKPAKIEKYNGKDCYKINYKSEWESGLFCKRIDKLLEYLPIAEAGTVHVDNFQCYVNLNPYVSAEEMQTYRKKMIFYLADKGIDITSEFTYREGRNTSWLYGKIVRDVTPFKYPIDCLGLIPASWWADKMTIKEYFDYYPRVYGGGLPKNKKARNLFYGNIHGEELFVKDGWQPEFIREFVTVNVPYLYLNALERIGFKDRRQNAVLYSDGVVAYSNGIIQINGCTVKDGKSVFLPYLDGYLYYSESEKKPKCPYASGKYTISEVTEQGLQLTETSEYDNFIPRPFKLYFLKKKWINEHII